MRHPRILIALVACAFVTFLFSFQPRFQEVLPTRLDLGLGLGGTSPQLDLEYIGKLNIAVVEVTSHHEEVIGSVLTVLHNLGANFTFHRQGFKGGFENIIKDVYPHAPSPIDDFKDGLAADQWDVVVLTTCDAKFWLHWDKLLDAMASSSAHVVCIPHEIENFHAKDNMVHLAPFAKKQKLSIVTLVEHATRRVREGLEGWVAQNEMWNHVPVSDLVPIFALPDDVQVGIKKTEIPSSAAILGRMLPWARRYDEVLSDLAAAISADPEIWGYRVLNPSKEDAEVVRYEPTSSDAFQLHLIGKPDAKPLDIPSTLLVSEEGGHSIVVIHQDTDYTEFYRLIGSMDLVLPAFKGNQYFDHRASAAIPAALISRTAILANARVLVAYNYLAPPALILHESDMTEVEAIARLRQGGIDDLRANERDWEGYEEYLQYDNMAVWLEVLKPLWRLAGV